MPLYTVLYGTEFILHASALTFEVPNTNTCIEELLNLAQTNGKQSHLARNAIFQMYHDEKRPFDQIKAFYGVEHLNLLTTEMKIDCISRFRTELFRFIRRRDPYLNIVRGNLINCEEIIKEPEEM